MQTTFYLFCIIITVLLIGMIVVNLIVHLPNKSFAAYLMMYGFIIGMCCMENTVQLDVVGIASIITIYGAYVILYVNIMDIVDVKKLIMVVKAHRYILSDVVCVMFGYCLFSVLFPIVTITFFLRYNLFNDFRSNMFFSIIAALMLIECLLLVISLLRLCYKTEYEISVSKRFFLLFYLIIICILSFAMLNTSLNCIDIYQRKVIIQEDYFIDYIYQYTCIFTLQYSSSENLTGLDKGLNIIALVYSYIFIAVVIESTKPPAMLGRIV